MLNIPAKNVRFPSIFCLLFVGATKHRYNWPCPSVCLSVTNLFNDPHVAPYWPCWPSLISFPISKPFESKPYTFLWPPFLNKPTKTQLYPKVADDPDRSLTRLQDRILRRTKSSVTAFPFWFDLPSNTPVSVSVQPADDGEEEGEEQLPCGVQYEIKVYAADHEGAKAIKGSTVTMIIRLTKKSYFSHASTNELQKSCNLSELCH